MEINEQVEGIKQAQDLRSKAEALGDSIIKNMNIGEPKEEKEGRKVEGTKKEVVKEAEPVKEEPKEDVKEETEEAEVEEKKVEEELIPASEVKKMQEKLTKRLDSEIAKKKELEEKLSNVTEKSSTDAKLQSMNEAELKHLSRQVYRELKNETDEAREEQLLDLQEKISESIRTIPQRFEKAQIDAYNAAAQEIGEANSDIDFDKEAVHIKTIAQDIYNRYPTLKTLKDGQAIALRQAFDHYKEVRQYKQTTKTTQDKVQDKDRELNKLKRKTSLDNSTSKGNVKTFDKVKWDKAKGAWDSETKLDAFEQIVDFTPYFKKS